jgi:hypothetical protein
MNDVIAFRGGATCSSQVGRHGGQQVITTGDKCSKGNVIHELGHAVGLFDEQSRNDRDSYVTVQWSNIKSEYQGDYSVYGSTGLDVGAYDYGSIMHYPKFSLHQAVNPNLAVLIPTADPEPAIGQRVALSAGDISTVATTYT